MAEKILNTRIALKYDTLANWQASSLVLKAGEMAIAEIPSSASESGLTPPAIGIKVGDGEKTFAQLGWIQAIAGDVQAWAKAASKPSYNATEIAAEVEVGDNKTVASRLSALELANAQDLVYRVIKDETANKWYLQSKASNAENTAYETVSTIDLVSILNGKQDVLTFDGTYDASTNKAATESTVSGAIAELTDTLTGTPGAGKAITAFDEVDGKVTATFENISILASQVSNAGTAITADVATTAIAENDDSSELVSKAQVAAYVDSKTAGLTGAMHFIGERAAIPEEGDYESGDVILVGTKEYVYDATTEDWVELGDEGSYALKTITVTAGNGLTGGGSLEANRTIAHAVPTGAGAANNVTATDNTFVTAVSFDDFGHVIDISTAQAKEYTFAEGNTNGAFTVTPTGGQAQSVTIHGLGSAAYKDLAANGVADNEVGLVTGDEVADYVGGIVDGLAGTANATAADGNEYYVLTGVTETDGVISKSSEVKLAAIAKTSNVNDLIQTSGDVLVFNCGTATTVV